MAHGNATTEDMKFR